MEAARARAAAEDSSRSVNKTGRRSSSSVYSSKNNSRRTSCSGSEIGPLLSQVDIDAELERRKIIARIDARLGYLDSVLDVSMDELQSLKTQIGGLEDGLSDDVKFKLSELLEVIEADVLEVNHQEKLVHSIDGSVEEAIVPAIPIGTPKKLIVVRLITRRTRTLKALMALTWCCLNCRPERDPLILAPNRHPSH